MVPGPEERIWFGRPVIALESYVNLMLQVQRLESQVTFLNDDMARLRHKIREIDRVMVQGIVSRETEEEEADADPTLF